MRNYIRFWHESTGWNGRDFSGPVTLIEACGDRSIIAMDGRYSLATAIKIGREEGMKRGYKGFSILRGEAIRDLKEIRKMEKL